MFMSVLVCEIIQHMYKKCPSCQVNFYAYSRRHKNGDVPSRPVPFKRKRVPVPFNKKTGTEREVEQATNGATNFANRS